MVERVLPTTAIDIVAKENADCAAASFVFAS
jgi:hypothetical protein